MPSLRALRETVNGPGTARCGLGVKQSRSSQRIAASIPRRECLTPLDVWSLANDDEVIRFDVGNLLGNPFGQRIVRSTVLPSPRPN
jgi:hypothetical protein